MSAIAPPIPGKKQIAKITSKGQITIPAETRRALGVKPGDKLAFEPTPDGIKVVRHADQSVFEKYRGTGNGLPELDGTLEEIVRYMREFRGHDEIDDLIYGTDR
jgi:antitoxin PrlF